MEGFCDIYHLKILIKKPTCFKNSKNPSCNHLFQTNCLKSFQGMELVETELPDFHKINFHSLKNALYKTKALCCMFDSKTCDSKKFIKLENKLMNWIPNFWWYTPLKQKHLRPNNAGFITKDMQKAIIRRSQTKNHFWKQKMAFMQICAVLLTL